MDLLIALAVAAAIIGYANSIGKRKATRLSPQKRSPGEVPRQFAGAPGSQSTKKPSPIEAEFRALCSGYAWKMQEGDSFNVFTKGLSAQAKARIATMYPLGDLRGHLISQLLRDDFANQAMAIVFATRKAADDQLEIAFGVDMAEFKKKCPLLYKKLQDQST